MAISFGTSNGVEMQLIDNADAITNWTGSHDGLEAYGFAIQGSDCVAVAIRKNENLPITCTNTVTGVSSGDQIIANMASSVAHLADSQTLYFTDSNSGQSSTYTFTSYISGKIEPFAFDCNTGTVDLDTYNLSTVVYTWDSSGQNVRTSNNIWMDAVYIGNGVDLTGTTASDALFTEGQAYDESNDTFNGVLTEKEGIIYSQSNVFISTTTGNSYGETIVFYETPNGNNAYTLEGDGTAVLKGTNILVSGTATLAIDMSSMTAFSITGGTVKDATSFTLASGLSAIGVVFDGVTTVTTSSATFDDNTLTGVTTFVCSVAAARLILTDVTTITLTNTLTDCTITTSDVLDISGSGDIASCTFIGDGTTTPGHAVDLGTVNNGSYSWTGVLDNGANQSEWAGSTQTSTAGTQGDANDAILIEVNSGQTFTISVASGATTPTVQNTGTGNLIISANQRNVSFTVNPLPSPNYEWRFYEVDAIGSLDGATALATGVENETSATKTNIYTYTYSAGTYACIQIIATGYEEALYYFELPDADSNIIINLETETNL